MHTPRPWTAFYKAKYDEWHVSVPSGAGSIKLALFPDGLDGPRQEREANARLIAAAPDLLAALYRLLELAPSCPSCRESEAAKYARAVLAKAETA